MKFSKITCSIIAVIMALSAASCNNYSNSNNKNQETKADTDTISVTISKDTADDKSSQKDESLAKEFILLNPNGVLEESKRAALEAGIYMPETVMNGAPAGTYPVQGFLLSSSTPSDTYGNGMSIVYRLSDGSLFVFDSGSSTVKYMLYISKEPLHFIKCKSLL